MKKKFVIIITLGLSTGCAVRKNLETPFVNPQNKEMIEQGGDGDPTHGTKFCTMQPDGSFTADAPKIESGLVKVKDSYGWAVAGGCVLRPIREAWAVLHNLEAIKFEDADKFTAKRIVKPKADFTHLYEITYFKSDIVDIDWSMQWYHGVGKGSFEEPESINIVYQRIRGTRHIPIWRGAIVLKKVTDTVTSISVRSEFRAQPQMNSENVDHARDISNEIISDVRNGEANWDGLNSGISVADAAAKTDEPPANTEEKPAADNTPAPTNGPKVECTISEPKTPHDKSELKKLVDAFSEEGEENRIKVGDKITVEGKIDQTVFTVIRQDGKIVGDEGTPLPLKLNINRETSEFKVAGTVEKRLGKLEFSMSGIINGAGAVSYKYTPNNEGGTNIDGSAKLENCKLLQ